jgi:hypothetical protein
LKGRQREVVTPRHDSSPLALGGDSLSVCMFGGVDEAAETPSSVTIDFNGCTNREALLLTQ